MIFEYGIMDDLTFVTFTSVFSLPPTINSCYYSKIKEGIFYFALLVVFEYPELLLTETLTTEFKLIHLRMAP